VPRCAERTRRFVPTADDGWCIRQAPLHPDGKGSARPCPRSLDARLQCPNRFVRSAQGTSAPAVKPHRPGGRAWRCFHHWMSFLPQRRKGGGRPVRRRARGRVVRGETSKGEHDFRPREQRNRPRTFFLLRKCGGGACFPATGPLKGPNASFERERRLPNWHGAEDPSKGRDKDRMCLVTENIHCTSRAIR
jgi:hypothetical protein